MIDLKCGVMSKGKCDLEHFGARRRDLLFQQCAARLLASHPVSRLQSPLGPSSGAAISLRFGWR